MNSKKNKIKGHYFIILDKKVKLKDPNYFKSS